MLTSILNQDEEIYTSYSKGEMPFRINFDDLVRTLQINPDLYHRPIVELEDYGYLVRGNNIFFDAGVKAGLNSFICDVNIRTLDDRHMSQFQLMDYAPEDSNNRAQFVIFMDDDLLRSGQFSDFRSLNYEIKKMITKAGFEGKALFEAIDFETAELRIPKGDLNPEESFAAAIQFISGYYRIRSINGLTSKTCSYGDLLALG